MEACIEALFNIEGENGKRKTIEMIRVLKGAISVSKSRTGEVIYHYNRHEKKALWRQLAKYDKDNRRSRLEIEQQKRDILRKWSLVFGRQRNFCDSIRGFDDMLAEAIVLKDTWKDGEEEAEEEEEVQPTQDELDRLEAKEKMEKTPIMEDPRKRRLFARQNPGQEKPATAAEAGAAASQPSTTTGMLPKINTSGVLFNGRIESEQDEKDRLEREAEEERKRKAKELPHFDKALVKDYLTQQKNMHEELLTRNTLMKIMSQANNDHVFFKYRMKTKLPASAHGLLRHIETERPGDVPGSSLERDVMTRQSSRSDGMPSRLTSTADGLSRSGESRGTSRLLARQLRSHGNIRKGSVPIPKGGNSLPLTSRLSITAGGAFPPKLGERAKTVHFS